MKRYGLQVERQAGRRIRMQKPKTIVWWAAFYLQVDILRWALGEEIQGGSLIQPDSQGCTLLHWLAIWGREDDRLFVRHQTGEIDAEIEGTD